MEREKVKYILMEPFYPERTVRNLAYREKAQVIVMPVDLEGENATYEQLFDQMVTNLKTLLSSQKIQATEKK